MNKKADLVVRLFCLATLIILVVFAASSSKKDSTAIKEDIKCTTPIPTVTPIPTPTITPEPTKAPTPTLVPIPTPEPVITEEPEELESMSTKTLYTEFTEEELELLFRVVEAEATGADAECKSHVASVIFNRLKEGWWGGDLTKNIMAKRQFEVITNGRYKKVTITESTILGCEMAFKEDTAQGALFFDSTNGKSWAAQNLTLIFRDHAGHDFYK